MPNWCSNQVTFTVENDKMEELMQLKQAFQNGGPFNFYLPVPDHVNNTVDPYIERWGTKWDLDAYSDEILLIDNSFSLMFETAWTPPIGFYKELARIGIGVDAYYLEPGCDFCGRFVDGVDHYFRGINSDNPDIDNICDALGFDRDAFYSDEG